MAAQSPTVLFALRDTATIARRWEQTFHEIIVFLTANLMRRGFVRSMLRASGSPSGIVFLPTVDRLNQSRYSRRRNWGLESRRAATGAVIEAFALPTNERDVFAIGLPGAGQVDWIAATTIKRWRAQRWRR